MGGLVLHGAPVGAGSSHATGRRTLASYPAPRDPAPAGAPAARAQRSPPRAGGPGTECRRDFCPTIRPGGGRPGFGTEHEEHRHGRHGTRASVRGPPDRGVVPAVWSRITNLTVERGEGSWLVTTEGERYLDYSSGIGVTNTGHAHPRVVAAVQAQAAKLLHGQQNIVYHEPGLRLYDRLRTLLPGGPWQAFLSNSGAEAVEAAVKLARAATAGRSSSSSGRLPRENRADDGPDDGQERLPGGLRAAPRVRLRDSVPELLPGPRGRTPGEMPPAPATGKRSST